MAELRPYPFGALVTRMFRELDEQAAVFDLPEKRFFRGSADRSFGVRFHGASAATPLGPAAGPQSQMAQNIVLAWLGGSRIHELKTVQLNDELDIPRPCIDMQTVGYNVEWSQELKLEQSLEEYVKGSMLVDLLVASGRVPMDSSWTPTIFDMSVGYDLAGIRSERVQAFVRGMLDASDIVDRLRAEIPAAYRELRDVDFRTRLSDTLTLSTFHGCPPDEIERIVDFLLKENGLHCVVKLNPMLLGPDAVRGLLVDALGYTDLKVPDTAFERDTRWEQALEFVERLGATAEHLGLGFGVKFTNTLIVENRRSFFPASEREMYLSGPPLHVLAMHLVQRFRATFGTRYPISFSAGIDRKNFADAAALGLVPITVCSDLLKPGGYGRSKGYLDELDARMAAVGARDMEAFCLLAYGHARAALATLDLAPESPERRACERFLDRAPDALDDAEAAVPDELWRRWVSAAQLLNTEDYVPRTALDSRYASAKNARTPKKIGSHLELFDCITCDKCVPVCPNDANFTFVLPSIDLEIVKVRQADGRWTSRSEGRLTIAEKHQIANFADFCNDCGNCDVFCPEDGGPYVIKPRFFGSLADWRALGLDGFYLESAPTGETLHGRIQGLEYTLRGTPDEVEFSGSDFAVRFHAADPLTTLSGEAAGEIDLTHWHILSWVRAAVYAPGALNHANLISRAW